MGSLRGGLLRQMEAELWDVVHKTDTRGRYCSGEGPQTPFQLFEILIFLKALPLIILDVPSPNFIP